MRICQGTGAGRIHLRRMPMPRLLPLLPYDDDDEDDNDDDSDADAATLAMVVTTRT